MEGQIVPSLYSFVPIYELCHRTSSIPQLFTIKESGKSNFLILRKVFVKYIAI